MENASLVHKRPITVRVYWTDEKPAIAISFVHVTKSTNYSFTLRVE